MSPTLALRQKLVAIARQNEGKVESSRNQAAWIKPLWGATSFPGGFVERQPYCAAGMAWSLREWLKLPEVLKALGLTPATAEEWRCKSASCFKDTKSWSAWAKKNKLTVLGKNDTFHTGDLIIFSFSHIEMYISDLPDGRYLAVGYNTDDAGSREGDGCFVKPRGREKIREVIRMLA